MTFLNPLVLFGLAAAALPVILHLLHRRRLRVVEFSTLRFLKEIQQTSLRRIQLRQWLLLILRTLLIIALVLVFARPALRADLPGGAGAATALVLLVDDSPSMSVRTSRGALLEQAKEAAARIISMAGQSDRIAFLPLSRAQSDSALPEFQSPSGARIDCEAAAQSEVSVPIGKGLAAAGRILGAAQEANREIYLITDGQATQFREHPSDSLPGVAGNTRVRIVQTPSNAPPNAGIVGIRSLTRVRTSGRPAVLAITLRNFGEAPLSSLPMSLYLDGVRVAQQVVAIPPRGSTTLTVPVIPRRAGILTGSVRIDEDALDLDNTRSFVLTVPSATRITLVGPAGGGSRFARLALTLGGDSLISGRLILREVPASQFSSINLASTDVLLIAGIDILTPAQGSTITSYLRRGGAVILFPGPSLDATSYRRYLWEPLALQGWNGVAIGTPSAGPISSPPVQVASFARIDYDHPLFAGLFADDRVARTNESIESPAILRTAGLRSEPRGHPIITLTNGEPFLSEFRAGGGSLLVFDVEAGTSWSDFPLKGIFAPLLHRSAAYLSSFAEDDSAVTVGSPMTLRIPHESSSAGTSLLFRSPGGAEERISSAAVRAGEGSGFFSSSVTVPATAIGPYRLFAVSAHDSVCVGARVAVIREAEGDLTELTKEELSSIAPLLGAEEGLEERIREARIGTELWLPLLLLAALIAAVEMWIARETSEGNPPH